MSLIFSGSGNPVTINGVDQGLTLTRMTAQASTSGTVVDFTGIPSWVQRITVMFDSISTNGTSLLQLQLGTSGGFVTTGYSGTYGNLYSNNSVQVGNNTTGFLFGSGGSATDARCGHCILTNISGNTWINSSVCGSSASTTFNWFGGRIALASALTQVRITTVNGTDTFDNGSVNVMYE
jgi:hypothetical protein